MKKAIVAVLLCLLFVFVGERHVRLYVTQQIRANWPGVQPTATHQTELIFSQPVQEVTDQLKVTLYYRYGDTDALGMALHTLDLGREETIARSIVDQLVEGPDASHGRLTGVFPHGTQVISVTTQERTVFVTLSYEFLGQPDGAPADWEDQTYWQEEATLRRWLAAQSIVCSLTEGGRYQRVQLYVARNDDAVPERIPLCWFDQQVRDVTVMLGACSRDEQVILSPQRALNMILQGWQERDWASVYALLCAGEDGQMPTFSAFEAQMNEASVSLTAHEISTGVVDASGQTATLVLDGAIRSAEGGDAQIIRESVPLMRVADNWAMRVDTLLQLMIRE